MKKMALSVQLEASAMPNLRGTKRCVNPKCNRRLYGDYVKLRDLGNLAVLLCGDCWGMPIVTYGNSGHLPGAVSLSPC